MGVRLGFDRMARLWVWMLGYTYVVLLWGTFVRASRSGSGCGKSWPKCEGGFFVDVQNIAQIVEYVHRLTSGLYGVFALFLVVYTIRKTSFARFGALCLGFLFVVFLEAWIGRMLVVHEYVVDDQRIKRLLWMGFHFLNTLVLITSVLLIWVKTKAMDARTHIDVLKSMARSWLVWGFLGLSLLGITTAFYDTTVVKGGGSAESVSALISLLRNMHPFVAVLYVLSVVYALTASGASQGSQRKRVYLLVIVVLNLLIGGLNIFFHHFTALQVLHVLCTHLIWLTLFFLFVPNKVTSQA